MACKRENDTAALSKLTPCRLYTLSGIALLHHATVWVFFGLKSERTLAQFFNTLDASFYTSIAESGYEYPLWVFFPAYPLTVRLLTTVTALPPWLVGATFSTALLFVCCLFWAKAIGRNVLLKGMQPKSALGWWLFAWAPGAWVFHAHHTEALFLTLSVSAFALATKRPYLAAAVAGIAALTRNQGVFVAATVALVAAQSPHSETQRRVKLKTFAICAAISAGLWSLFPL